MKIAALVGLVALAFAAPSSARHIKPASSPGAWTMQMFVYQNPVEQQDPGVVNPTILDTPFDWVGSCIWDADDFEQWIFKGDLGPGQDVSITRCVYADWHEHLAGITDDTADPRVQVTVTVGPTTVTAQNIACVLGPDYTSDTTALPTVPESNGGRAALTTVTFTITNTSNRTLRRQEAIARFGDNVTFPGGTAIPDQCKPILGARYGYDPAWQTGSR